MIAVPFVVRARLGAELGVGEPWSISLDGLLAGQIREDMKVAAWESGEEYVPYDDEVVPEDLALPLVRCTAGGDVWHWMATFARAEGEVPGPHVHYWSARPDQQDLGAMGASLPMHVSERQGRYRSRVMPLPVVVARSLVWRGVGDPQRVEELVAGIPAIGRKRAAGHGCVLEWTVEALPKADQWEYGHLTLGDRLGRPVPAQCLAGHGAVRHRGIGHVGIRPPYMHPSRRADVVIPL